MILYQYRCPHCGAVRDEWMEMGSAPNYMPCSCGHTLIRLFTKVIRSFIDIPPKPPKGESIVDRMRKALTYAYRFLSSGGLGAVKTRTPAVGGRERSQTLRRGPQRSPR